MFPFALERHLYIVSAFGARRDGISCPLFCPPLAGSLGTFTSVLVSPDVFGPRAKSGMARTSVLSA